MDIVTKPCFLCITILYYNFQNAKTPDISYPCQTIVSMLFSLLHSFTERPIVPAIISILAINIQKSPSPNFQFEFFICEGWIGKFQD